MRRQGEQISVYEEGVPAWTSPEAWRVMDVALGAGWPGILLHEAIGHGLEGDFNRKDQSAFAGLMGQRIDDHVKVTTETSQVLSVEFFLLDTR